MAAMAPDGVGTALELAAAEGCFTVHLARRCTKVHALDVSSIALARAADRCRDFSNVDYLLKDFFNEPIAGTYDLITCAEVLYYLPDRASLRPVLEKIRDALGPGGWFLQSHAFELGDDPRRTAMDWSTPFGGQAVTDTLREMAGLVLVRSLRTELYSIELYRRTDEKPLLVSLQVETAPVASRLEAQVSRNVVWHGALRTRRELQASVAREVPVTSSSASRKMVSGFGALTSSSMSTKRPKPTISLSAIFEISPSAAAYSIDALTRFTNWLPTWVAPGTSSRATTTPT